MGTGQVLDRQLLLLSFFIPSGEPKHQMRAASGSLFIDSYQYKYNEISKITQTIPSVWDLGLSMRHICFMARRNDV